MDARDPARDPREPAWIAERLEVEQDELRLGVFLPVLEEVVGRDVGLVADRDERRKPEVALGRLLQQRETKGAALRGEPDRPRRQGPRAERRVQAGCCDGDAEAVGADEPPAASADEREEPILALAPLAADLGEPCRDHAKRAHARREGRLGCLEHVRTGKTDDRQVDDLGHVFEGLVRAHAGNRLAGAVQGIRGAGELGVEHVSEEAPADRLRTWGGADDGDARGREEGAERRDDGEMVPLVDVREVLRGCGDRKGDLDRSPVEHARDR